jgi:hypothetical protein
VAGSAGRVLEQMRADIAQTTVQSGEMADGCSGT